MKRKTGTYKQLSLLDRERIGIYLAMGMTIRAIGRKIGRHHTSISREISRNNNAIPMMSGYVGSNAHETTRNRRSKASSLYKSSLRDKWAQQHIQKMLALGWSPEQIANTLGQYVQGAKISHETVYQYIYKDFRKGIGYLARRHKQRYRKYAYRKHQISNIPNRISITEREIEINIRQEFGNWESDSIVSGQSAAAINVLLERKSRLVKIQFMEAKNAHLTCKAIRNSLEKMPTIARKSITYDNGSENAKHEHVNATLGTKSFFCQPYHSWEKGSVENVNGLIRRFIPKKTNIANLSQEQLSNIEFLLNNRPRKCLNYRTPREMFIKFCGALPP
jgi:IS30 family transposase